MGEYECCRQGAKRHARLATMCRTAGRRRGAELGGPGVGSQGTLGLGANLNFNIPWSRRTPARRMRTSSNASLSGASIISRSLTSEFRGSIP